MNTIIIVLLVMVAFFILTAAVLILLTLPTIVKGYRQQREDEFALAEYRSAQVKASRHRNVT